MANEEGGRFVDGSFFRSLPLLQNDSIHFAAARRQSAIFYGVGVAVKEKQLERALYPE
ncbi:hypothetical protein [Paenibacillus kribbensis]|uniref:hypothetical protein n=1 Tax=Paenibacillus kribbensis TaxID=172713 RepID=UPI0012FD2D66|nr:hypothetical protein [Paenibacillus kribbensis]